MKPGSREEKIFVLRKLLEVRKRDGVRKLDAVAAERLEIRRFVSRLRGRVELHKGGSVLDVVLDHIDGRGRA